MATSSHNCFAFAPQGLLLDSQCITNNPAVAVLRIAAKRIRKFPVSASGAKFVNRTSYRVIYGDTDQMGVVYYANYLRWFELGRSEFLREIGLPYSTIEKAGTHFPVVEVSCRYAQSACYDDLVQIETALAELGRASLSFHYRILRAADHVLLATGSTRHGCIDQGGRMARIPQSLSAVLVKGAP